MNVRARHVAILARALVLIPAAALLMLPVAVCAQMPPFAGTRPHSLVVDAPRGRVAALNFAVQNSLDIFDVVTHVRRSVPIAYPHAPGLDASTGRIHVPAASSLVVVDGATASILATVPLAYEYGSRALVDVDARKVIVLQDRHVAIVDADSLAVSYIDLDVSAYDGVLDTRNRRLYLASLFPRTVLVVLDLDTRATSTIPVLSTPSIGPDAIIRVNPSTSEIVFHFGGGTLAIVDAATHAITTVPVPYARAMAVDGKRGRVLLPNLNSPSLTVVDTATRGVTSVPLPAKAAAGIALEEATGTIYMGLADGGVVVMNSDTLSQFTIAAGAGPGEIVLDSVRQRAYVADGGGLLVVEGGAVSATSASAYGMAVEYYNKAHDRYVLTSNLREMSKLDNLSSIWVRTGATVGTFLKSEGTVPVCRFYLPPGQGDSHLMMPDPAECAATAARFPGYVFESPDVFRVAMPDAVTGACAPGLAPLYRLWNRRADSNHRYAVDLATRDAMVAAGSVAEGYGPDGVGMCVPVPPTYTLP